MKDFGQEAPPGGPEGVPRDPAAARAAAGNLRSRTLQAAVSLILAGGLLYLFFRKVDFPSVRRAISTASGGWLLLSLAIAITTFVLRAIRWTYLLRKVDRVPVLPAFLATAVGFAANNLPAKVGEVIRPALLARKRRLPFSPLFASILFERALDGSSVVFYFVLAVWLGLPGAVAGPAAFAVLRTGAALGACLFVGLVGLAGLLLWRRDATERAFERVAARLPERWRPRARAAVASFPEGFASLGSPKLAAAVALWSLFMWLVINLQIYAMLEAFHIDLPFSACFVVCAAAVLGLAVPTPGGIGSYQAALQYALTRFYGAPIAAASAFALMAWAISFIPITLIGLAALAMRAFRPDDVAPGGRRPPDGGR